MTDDAATPAQPRTALLARIPALLTQHAGHESWGENDGRLDSVLLAWGLNPTDFMESLLGWGYTIAIEAQARPAVASEGLRAALASIAVTLHMEGRHTAPYPDCIQAPCKQARAALASDAGSVPKQLPNAVDAQGNEYFDPDPSGAGSVPTDFGEQWDAKGDDFTRKVAGSVGALDVPHEHAWGPKVGYARMVALGIAHKWPELVQVCVMCGAAYAERQGEQ